MTLPTSGNPISISQIDVEIGQSATYQSSLQFLNSLITPGQSAGSGTGGTGVAVPSLRQSHPNMNAFYGLTYYQSTANGNCTNNGANCASNCNCDCGNINCSATMNCDPVNCVNCDTQSYLQNNCNCVASYNCNSDVQCFSSACNCSKIICTKLYEYELMDSIIYRADQDFGIKLAKEHRDVYVGYRAWANVVVEWMEGRGPRMFPWLSDNSHKKLAISWATKWAYDIATPWSEEMAHMMGKKEKGNLTGKMIMYSGIPICKLVGVWRRWFGPSDKPAGWWTGLALIILFVYFKLVAETGRFIELFKFKFKSRIVTQK